MRWKLLLLSGFPFHFFDNIDQAFNRRDRFVELSLLTGVELHFDDAFDALGTDHDGNADIHALHTIFAVQVGRTGQNALFVLQIRLGHGDGRRGRCVESRTIAQQLNDLTATRAGALDDRVDLGLDPWPVLSRQDG